MSEQIKIKLPPPPDDTQLQQGSSITLPPPPPGFNTEGVGALEAVKRGYQWSSAGLALRGEMPEHPEWQPSSWAEKVAMATGQMAGDIPAGIVGGLVFGGAGIETGPGAAATAAAGAFAAPELMRQILVEGYNSGQIQDVGDFVDALKRIGWNTTKAAVVGYLTGGTGYYAKPLVGTAGKLGAETAVMTGASSALEGEVPTASDFAQNAVLMFGMEGSIKGAKILKRMYKKTGKHPVDVRTETQTDPVSYQDALDQIEGKFGQRKVEVVNPEQLGLTYEQLAKKEGIELPTEKQTRPPAADEGVGALPEAPAPSLPKFTDSNQLSMWFLKLPEGEQSRLSKWYEVEYDRLTEGARHVTPEELDSIRMEEEKAAGAEPDLVSNHIKASSYTPESTIFNTPNLIKNTTYAWRAMGEKEYSKLMSGEKNYTGDKAASRGNFLASVPESAAQYKAKGKYLVEFGNVKIEGNEGLALGSIAGKDNITKVWRYDGKQWTEIFNVDKTVGKMPSIEIGERPSGAPSETTLSNYMAGIAEAVKKDVTGNELGITYQPFRNIDKFIRENKLKLSPEEQARILDLMRNAAKKGLKDQDIVDLAHKEINNFVGDVGNIQPQPVRPARSSTISTLEQNNVIPIVEQGINTIKTHGSKWIFSTPHILRKLPEAVKWARKTIDANLKSDFEIGRDRMYFEDVLTRLTEEQRGQIQKTYDKFVNLLAAKNKTTEQIVADRQKAAQWATVDPLAKASLDIATYYSEVRDAYIDSRVEIFKMKRGDEAKAAIEVANLHDQSGSKNLELYVLSPEGVTVENPVYINVADKYHMSYNRLNKVTNEYYKIVNWGLESYRTRIERGMFKITLKRGADKHDRVLGFEQTRLDAIERAKELQEGGKLKGEEIVIQRVPWRKPDPTKAGKKSLRGMEMFEALNTYSYIMRKKIHFEPLSQAMRREFRNDPSSVKYADYVRSVLYDQLGDAKGTYSYGDKIVDSMIYWMQEKSPLKDSPLTNIPPGLYGRGMRYGRWAMSNIKLGYRPMAGALNLFWGTRNIYVKNGLNFVSQAAKFMKTTEGKRLIENNEWALGMDLARTEAGSTTALKPWEPVYWFSKPEPFIRKLALTTNYLYGKMKLGLGEAEAQAYAREGVRTQAWLYNNAALPKLFRGHTRKALFQFKSAMVHNYEFIRGLTPQQLVRFLATEALISGPRGTLLFIKSLPFLAAFGIMDDIEEWLLKRKVPENVPLIGGQPYTFGVPGLAGIDVSQAATLQFLSQDLEDNFGPLLTTAIDAYKSTLGAAVKGYPMEVDPIVRTAPFLNNWMQFLDSVDPDNDGWVYSDQGKKYKIGSWYDRALLLSGATPIERTKQSVMLRVLRNEEDRINKQKREVYDRLVQLKPGEPITKSLLDKAVEYGITSEGLSRRLLLYNLDPKLRETLKADALRKMRVMGLYSEIE